MLLSKQRYRSMAPLLYRDRLRYTENVLSIKPAPTPELVARQLQERNAEPWVHVSGKLN